MQQQTAEGQHPVAKGVQARKRHVARPDHQGHQIVRQADQGRHDHQKNHGGAMHREELAEGVGRDKIIVGPRQLNAHEQRFNAPHHEKEKGGQQIENANSFVVHRGNPTIKPARFFLRLRRGHG